MTHFCTSCGAALRPNVKFCTACGAGVVADTETDAGFDANAGTTTLEDDADVADFSTSKMPWIIGGSVLALLVAYAIFIAFFAPKKSESLDAANAAGNAVSTVAANPAITGQAADMYVVADANVRDQPTAQGSNIVTKLTRGTKINGTLQIGADGTSAWMKLTDGTGYIGAVNLNTNVPPTLAKTFADMKWNVEEGTDLLAFPAAGSAVVAHLNKGDQTTLAGVTDNGYAEAKRSKGGVAYFFVTAGNDRTGQLAVAAVSGSSSVSQTMTLSFNRSNCSYGPDFENLFDVAVKDKLMRANGNPDSTMSGYARTNGLLFGLRVTGVGAHYESSDIYFSEDSGTVVKAFMDNGYRFEKNAEFVGYSLIDDVKDAAGASVKDTDGEEAKYGKSAFGCGL
jgi:zinc-ribbon domain